jgi:hypothetical protein
MIYLVRVYYRTNSGCNAKDVAIEADSPDAALQAASDKVRRMRGVIRIDGGDWHNPEPLRVP